MQTYIKCPVCKAKNTREYFRVKKRHGRKPSSDILQYDYLLCNNCGVLYLNIKNHKRDIHTKVYNSEYYKKGNPLQRVIERMLTRFTNNIRKLIILDYFPSKKRLSILDVGCGDGDFLKDIGGKRFNRFGIDIGVNEKKKMDGIKIYDGDFLNTKINEKYDVITMFHVIEHLQEPRKALVKIKALLKKGGVILISTPNTNSFGFTLGKKEWFHLDPPFHTVLFNKNNLSELCTKQGLKILKVYNDFYQFPLDLLWSLKKYKKKYLYYVFYPLVKILSKECLTYVIVKNEKN